MKGFKDGIGTNAQFNNVHGITIDKQGNLFVTDNDDAGSDRIRKSEFLLVKIPLKNVAYSNVIEVLPIISCLSK